MSAPAPEKVFPAPAGPPAPAAPAGGGGGGGGFVKANQQTLMWAGAAGVVILALVNASRGQRPAADDDSVPTLDTSRTDFYNELQPELEAIQDRLEQLGDRPTATTPVTPTPGTPTTPVKAPTPPPVKTGPKPPTKGPKVETYMIRKGDTLTKIARQFKVPGGVARLYYANRHTLHAAAVKAGRKNSGNGHWIYPGTRIVIPT